jgi:predicted dehydrogenase
VDVAKLARAAGEHGRLVFPAHVLRFDARYAAVRERLRASGDTPPRFISTQRHFQGQAHAVYGRVHPALNALIHDIDVAIWLVGEPPDRVSGYERTGEGPRAPRLVSAVLEWRDGPSALLENAWNLVDGMAAGYEFRCTVMHDEFTAIVAPAADVAVFERAGTATFADVHLWPELPYGVAGALRAELMHFALCACDHRPSPIVGLADAERAITVAAAVVRSASGEGWVDVPGA